ncbi:MAG: glycosyltransferase family 39 protein [Candidatus Aminicenantes bacterium]|nr:glycosyltransferase family 39 protein [Candidatus Aminicenantes bacterium]
MNPHRSRVYLLLILFLALGLRTAHWLDVRKDPFIDKPIMDSYEYDRWGQEIAAGDWLGSEVFFQAPLYPYFLAAVYSVFGHSLDAVYLLQILIALAGIYALYRGGLILHGPVAGLTAAALAAGYGVFIHYDVQVLKESSAVACICFLLWGMLEVRRRPSSRLWLVLGLLSGVLCLLRENMLLVFPFLLFLAWNRKDRGRRIARNAALMTSGLFLVLLPVAFRNYIVGGVFAPTTFQGGVNFYIGNNAGASGTYQSIVPGKQMPWYERTEPIRIAERETGRKLSTTEVSRFWLNRALDWAVHHPLDFARLQLKKTGMFWSWYEWPDAVDYYYVKHTSLILSLPLLEFGGLCVLFGCGLLLWRRRLSAFFPLFLFITAWMLSTVIFFLFSRYRLPVVPALLLIAAGGISLFLETWEKRAVWINGLCLVVVSGLMVFPLVFNFQPRMDIVHYNLGLIFEKEGNFLQAERHYGESLRANPSHFLSHVNLGNIAARKKDWSRAEFHYRKAVEFQPESDGAIGNLAGALLALREPEKAEVLLEQALRLNPDNILALHNKAILLAQTGRIREALVLTEQVLQLSPGWPPADGLRRQLLVRMKEQK